MVRAAASGILLAALALPARSESPGAEKRDREWLVRYLTGPLPDTPRNRRSLALINQSLDGKYLDLDVAWFQKSRNSGYRSRAQTNALGRLAFCCRTPGLKYHQDAKALEILREAYRGVVRNVSPEGKFTWEDKLNEYGYDGQNHEHAWRLEPLLAGYLWAGDKLPPEERREIEAALRRAADWLMAHPMNQTNNRGAVWCAVLTLYGLYFEKKEYLESVEKHARAIIDGVVLDDGESGEHTGQYGGGGPCSNYTYTGWSYVYLYWLLSGKSELDAKMLRAGRWLALYNTLSGCPLVAGASVRRRYVCPHNFQDVLPSFERFSHQDPFFAVLADHALAKKERFFPRSAGHIISPLLWSILERGGETKPGPWPDWYANHTQIYDRPEVEYALVHREYQSGIVFRGRTREGYNYPLRRLQSFAFGDEYPVLLHSDYTHSTTAADGIDTASANVDKGPHGWEVLLSRGLKLEKWRSELATIVDRRKTLWTLHAFTPVSAIVIYGGAKGPVTSRWMINRAYAPSPTLDATARRVTFQGQQGRIFYLGGEAKLSPFAARPGKAPTDHERDDPMSVLEVVAGPPVSGFAFSNDSFRFEKHDPGAEEVAFSDASGGYRLSLQAVLGAEGNINRKAPMRLVLREEK